MNTIRIPLKMVWIFLLIALPCFSFEKSENVELHFDDLKVFTDLTKNLNQLSQHEGVFFRIRELGQKAVIVSQPQFPLTSKKDKTQGEPLPPLSTDSSKINPVDIQAFGLGPTGDGLGLDPYLSVNSANAGLLPLPQARVVAPVGEQRSNSVTEAPLKTVEELKNPDVITGLTPKNTRFGKDRYDDNFFLNQNPTQASGEGRTQIGGALQEKDANGNGSLKSAQDDGDQTKKKEQEARESFQQTMKEFAERTEEKEAFRLVDYYDLKNVLAKHESILSSFENDDFDERFVRNARTIYDRFGDRDNSSDKKTFEQFLKRVQTDEITFRSQDVRQSGFPSSRTKQNHRVQSSE